jgi:hypothetical protein
VGLVGGETVDLHYVREPDLGVTSVNYDLDELLSRSEEPA